MSQIASFYLFKDGQRQELSDGECSGEVYTAIWDYCEAELEVDGRFHAPQTEDVLDCVLLDEGMAAQLLEAFSKQDVPQLSVRLASDWDLPARAVQRGLETLLIHLEEVKGSALLLYEMI